MLFAAGLGTRLKPLTDSMPKAMVPVAGKPLIDHVMRRLISQGATEVVVNVHHFAHQIIDFLRAADYGISVRISDESDALLDTGGGLRKAARLFTDDARPILIHNVDILSNADLRAFYQAALNEDAALLVSERNTQRYLLFNEDDRLCGWTNIATGEVRSPYPDLRPEDYRRYAFSGIHCFAPRLFERMTGYPEKFPIMPFYLDICRDADVRAHRQAGLRLMDVGKLDTLHEAEAFLHDVER